MDPTHKTALTLAFNRMHTALVNIDLALQAMGDEQLLERFRFGPAFAMVLFMHKTRVELGVPYKVSDEADGD